jgi:hypothetical protein
VVAPAVDGPAGAEVSWFSAGVAALSTAENTAATTPGNPEPTGVDTVNNTANPAHTAAGPAARALTHSRQPPITRKIKSPTLGMSRSFASPADRLVGGGPLGNHDP